MNKDATIVSNFCEGSSLEMIDVLNQGALFIHSKLERGRAIKHGDKENDKDAKDTGKEKAAPQTPMEYDDTISLIAADDFVLQQPKSDHVTP